MSRCKENASFFSENSGKPASMSLIVLTLADAPALPGLAGQQMHQVVLSYNVPFCELGIGFSKLFEIVDNFAK
jgi:hypothetical protein